uniref:Zona pellucida sperm-binding protein 3 n=1 Tax=Echeneis naucrates TaxID=173247 RepID=A0A665VBL2_ECHNA
MMAFTGQLASLLLLSLLLAVAAAIRPLKEGPMIDAEGREYKSAAARTVEPTVQIECTDASMIIYIKADLFNNGRLVSPEDLFLGGVEYSESSQCRAAALSDTEYIIEAALQNCGSKLTVSADVLTYSNELVFSPPASFHGITRLIPAVVPVSCHYKRSNYIFLHSGPQQPFYPPAQYSSGQQSYFSLKLMTDDWRSEMFPSAFYLGDILHLEASYNGPDTRQSKLFIDTCVATLTPDPLSTPRYYFIENHGCVTDAKEGGSNALLKPRTRSHSLQLQLDALLFHLDSRNSVFITCQLKAIFDARKSSPVNKACNYIRGRWENVDGHDGVCRCCDSTCHQPPIQSKYPMVCGTVTLGPLMIFPSK